MNILTPPFVSKLEKSDKILIAGAGGGFDVFCGLPLYFSLINQGKEVYLANLSFTELEHFKGKWLTKTMMEVTHETVAFDGLYFPEWYLAKWFKEVEDKEIPVYSFVRSGVVPLIENYRLLIEKHNIDTIVLVDGGTDSLMRGDEDRLGTPKEDYLSLAALKAIPECGRMLMCLGFGVDHYHGVSNDLTFKAIAEMTELGGYLGCLSLLKEMPEVQKYKEISEYTFAKMDYATSIVSSSILSAVDGHYGDHHSTERTKGSRLWINPLMPICWFFDFEALANRNIMLDQLMMTEFHDQIMREIMRFRAVYKGIQRRSSIPD